jgi:hypothetical protein
VIWRIEFGGNPQDVTITTDGIASCHRFSAMSLELVEDPRWRLGMTVLIDHSSLVAPDAYSEGLTPARERAQVIA